MKARMWERQEGESEEAFQAFVLYRDSGADRSIREVAKALSKSATLIARWSTDWNWGDRALGYDNWLDREVQEQNRKDVLAMRKRHAQIAMLMQQKVVDSIRAMSERDTLKPDQAAKWLDIAVKVERLARGEATENVKEMPGGGRAGSFDLESMPVEDLEALERIAARADGAGGEDGPGAGGGVEAPVPASGGENSGPAEHPPAASP